MKRLVLAATAGTGAALLLAAPAFAAGPGWGMHRDSDRHPWFAMVLMIVRVAGAAALFAGALTRGRGVHHAAPAMPVAPSPTANAEAILEGSDELRRRQVLGYIYSFPPWSVPWLFSTISHYSPE